ncbi:MAG: hypothetical protein PHR44_03910 [Candidatus Omnitrophica bacterium]|nr:hypothetical protein [Candidatus Omnitrophota bacterium]
MERAELLNKVKDIFDAEFADSGYVLVDISTSIINRQLNIRLAVDRKDGGINLGECAGINRRLCEILDREDLVQESYVLEVASPGVDRPLAGEADFRRNIHHTIFVMFEDEAGGISQIEGELLEVNAGGIAIKAKDKTVDVPLDRIKKAKQRVKLGD